MEAGKDGGRGGGCIMLSGRVGCEAVPRASATAFGLGLQAGHLPAPSM
jgi:hypothetical protein